jgi:TRAP-type C4-dicarboxylate transport system permease small subunit
VSEPGDGSDKPDSAAPIAPSDVPPTRKHEALPPAEPPARESHLKIEVEPHAFPNDGKVSRIVRLIDNRFGDLEQGLLFGILAVVVVTAAAAAISDKVLGEQLGRWWFAVVRGGTFSIAMFGAVFATHQQRHLAMDLISRQIPARGRLVLGIVLKLFTIKIASLLYTSGMHQRETIGTSGEPLVVPLLHWHITDKDIVTVLPIGAAMIIFHSVLHLLIDGEYLIRGKLPPEKQRSGH